MGGRSLSGGDALTWALILGVPLAVGVHLYKSGDLGALGKKPTPAPGTATSPTSPAAPAAGTTTPAPGTTSPAPAPVPAPAPAPVVTTPSGGAVAPTAPVVVGSAQPAPAPAPIPAPAPAPLVVPTILPSLIPKVPWPDPVSTQPVMPVLDYQRLQDMWDVNRAVIRPGLTVGL